MKVVTPIKKNSGEDYTSLDAMIASYSNNSYLNWIDPHNQLNNKTIYFNKDIIYGQSEINKPLSVNHRY